MSTHLEYKETKGFQAYLYKKAGIIHYLDKIYLFVFLAENREMDVAFWMLLEINH